MDRSRSVQAADLLVAKQPMRLHDEDNNNNEDDSDQHEESTELSRLAARCTLDELTCVFKAATNGARVMRRAAASSCPGQVERLMRWCKGCCC